MNSEYLKESVGKYLSKSLCEVAIRRPERPIEFLAYHLISLYEKDLEMQRIESKNGKKYRENDDERDLDKDHEKSQEEVPVTPVFSQMFKERLSISPSREVQDTSSTESMSLTSVERGPDKPSSEEEISPVDEEAEEPKSSESISTDIYDIPERKPSVVDGPVTEEEEKEFGTSDPFLARRESKIFDVNYSSIGNKEP